MGNFALQQEISARQIGVLAQSVNTTVTGDWFGTEGFNQITIEVNYTFGAGTNLTMYIDTTEDVTVANPVAHRLQTQAIAAGTATLSNYLYSKAAGAANQFFTIEKSINHKNMRLVFAMTGAPNATDAVTARVRLGVV